MNFTDQNDQRLLNAFGRDINRYPALSSEETARLADLARAGNKRARNKLVKHNLRFVRLVAFNYLNHGLPLLDLIAEGGIGLTIAAERYQPCRKVNFCSYAVWWIRQCIVIALAMGRPGISVRPQFFLNAAAVKKIENRLEITLGRGPTFDEVLAEFGGTADRLRTILNARNMALSLDAPRLRNESTRLFDTVPDVDVWPDEALANKRAERELQGVLSELPGIEAKIITLYFGLFTNRAHTLEEIGQRVNLTRERIRQLKEKTLVWLRHPSRANALREILS